MFRKRTVTGSQEYSESIINTVREPLIILDQDLRVVTASRSFYEIFKVKSEETVGQLIYNLGNKQWDIPRLRELLETILPQKATFDNYEVEHDFTTIGRRIMLLNARQIQRVLGKERIILLAIEDITERKEIEAGLEKTRKELAIIKKTADETSEFAESVINTVREPLIALDQDLRVVKVSRSFYEFFKVKPEETVGQLIYNLGNKQWDIPRLRELLETILPQKTTFDNFEVEHDFATIGRRIMLLNARQIQRVLGKERIILLAFEDITERRDIENGLEKARKELEISEVRYRRLFEAAKDGILILDADTGQVVDVNPFLLNKLGYSRQEVVGRTVWELGFLKDIIANKAKFVELQRNNYVHYGDLPMETSDGRSLEVEFVSNVYIEDHTKVIQCNIRDLTDFKRLELEAAHQRVTRLESIGVLAGGIAHDFNNILTAILGNISLAKIKAQTGSELRNWLEGAEKASLRAQGLTQQLLTFSKGGVPIKKLTFLSALLKDTASFAISGSNINCQFSIPDDLWHAEIDKGQISQVINNLIINARQAMPSGGTIQLNAENMALTERQSLGKSLPLETGNYIRIAVIDQGTGIPEAHLDKIFDPFFTTKQTGSGLGLASSFSIAHNHGGYISVESRLGVGSTFYVYLPASTKTETTRIMEDKEIIPLGNARILVMDDEKSVREVAGDMLKYLGVEDIEFAANGADAIKLYQEAMKTGKPFDAVILDLTIPGGMGGKETIKKLREIDPKIKAIVSSGYSSESAISEYKEYGFSGVVAKPYTIDQLHQALHELIG